jgi:glycosyltransferase involved in cell wall biosynthesis
MKIIRLTTLLDFGGQERKYLSFTSDASLLHNEYCFAAIGHGGHAEKIIKERGFKVVIFNKKPNITNLANIVTLYRWFKKEKPDVVHTAAAEANFHGVIAAKLAGVKIIIAEEIGLPNHSSKAKIIFKWVYKLTSRVICVSKAVKQFLLDIGEIPTHKGIVLYNPVSAPKAFVKNTPSVFTIVCVGRLEKVKNQQVLIRAISRISQFPCKLILVGDGRERENLEELTLALGCKDRVEFIGFSSEPERYLSAATLFVLPSLSEGFGIAVLEAMQQGLPCLCSRVGGVPEFLEEGKTGWLFTPNDEEELVTKLITIMNLPQEKLAQIGSNAKDYVASGFTEKSYVQHLENIYQELYD